MCMGISMNLLVTRPGQCSNDFSPIEFEISHPTFFSEPPPDTLGGAIAPPSIL
jgi:hypothetical protein